jgi:hypothetical protein
MTARTVSRWNADGSQHNAEGEHFPKVSLQPFAYRGRFQEDRVLVFFRCDEAEHSGIDGDNRKRIPATMKTAFF